MKNENYILLSFLLIFSLMFFILNSSLFILSVPTKALRVGSEKSLKRFVSLDSRSFIRAGTQAFPACPNGHRSGGHSG